MSLHFSSKNWVNKFWVAIFFAAIWLPLVGSIFKWNTSSESIIGNDEGRRAATFPKFNWSLDSFQEFPKNFDAYYNDFFGFREGLIAGNNFIKARVLGSSSSSLVILGKYPWLFFGNEDGYYRSRLFTSGELRKIKQILEGRRNWLASQGIHYIFAIAPNKPTIYPEFLPDAVKYIPSYTRLDQLTEYLQENSDLEIVDLRTELRNAKTRYRVYEKTDTHWNEVGAYFAYRALINRAKKNLPAVGSPLELSDFTLTSNLESGGDLARMLKLQSVYQEEVLRLVPKSPRKASNPTFLPGYASGLQKVISRGPGYPSFYRAVPLLTEVKDERLPRAIVFGDSFASRALINFLVEHFRQTLFVGQQVFDVELIQKKRPDIVIQEVVERGLNINVDSPVPGNFLDNSAPISANKNSQS